MKKNIGSLLFLAGIFLGFWSLGVLIYGYFSLFTCENGRSACSELLMIPAVASLFGFPAWASTSIGYYLIQSKINRYLGYFSYAVTALMALIFFYFTFID